MIPSPDPTYDAYVPVKGAPSQLELPGALVGRFLPGDDAPTPVALSRRARARLRAAQGR